MVIFLVIFFAEKISEDGRAVRFPRFSPDDRWLVYLDTLDSGPHNMCSRLMMVSGVLFLIFYFHQSVYQHILSPSVSFLCLSTRFLSTLFENVCFIYYSLLLFKLTVLFPTFKCKFPAGSASGKGDMMDSSLFLILSTVPKVGLLESVYVCKHMLVCVHAYMYVAT